MVITATANRYSVSIFDLPFVVDIGEGVLSNDISTVGTDLTALIEDSPENGRVELNPNGAFIYTPDPGFLGSERFTYTATDSDGIISDTAVVRIQVNILPDPPADAIRGTRHADLLRGGFQDDYLIGLEGNDTLIGRVGDDLIDGGSGSDLILGRSGEEVIDGGTGHDTLDGGSDQDVLFGGAGHDVLFGQRGDDFLLGGRGQDSLQGGSGNDTLSGGIGLDTLRGGSGADFFVLEIVPGVDNIADFDLGQDTIALANGLVFEDLSFTVAGNVTRISAEGELLARVWASGNGTLSDSANFTLF